MPPRTPQHDPGKLHAAIRRALPADRARLSARLKRLESARSRSAKPDSAEALAADIKASTDLFARRRALKPKFTYPEDLPVAARREEIIEAIREHQVIVICGETGSGKTTQLPKMCLDAGLGIGRSIAHTQPRRIAARAVSARIAEELGVAEGTVVGHKVRFTDRTKPETLIRLVTDGILLAETQRDRRLSQYDAIIIDEAHERSLNIDFLMGYLAQLLPKRPDLKIIVTSATINPEAFADHFEKVTHARVPIIQVSGRTYPVEVRYRPPTDSDAEDDARAQAVLSAVDEACADGPGDILIFMPGEREIRRCAHELRRHLGHEHALEVLPLYARLSPEEQQRVFKPHHGRRVVVATNVAETSITVPGIRYVVDPGNARISRYAARTRVQGLPIEPVSQASAAQRAGRCGRVAPGVCFRLYSEPDFQARETFTPPEILRTNLAAVVLQMAALKLGRPEDFPFVEPPDRRLIRDAYETLRELHALDEHDEPTDLGRTLARLPIDPRLGRMILAGRDNGCLRDVLVIAAALTAPDPRLRPPDKEHAADEAHAEFAHATSDFLTHLNLWAWYHEQAKGLSRRKLERVCEKKFLIPRRINEWREIYRQIRSVLIDEGYENDLRDQHERADDASIHQALLAGLLTSIGRLDERAEYAGAHGSRFYIHPASVCFSKKPKWIVAAELVRTTRLYARCVAPVQPEWIEHAARHLVKHAHSDPRWDERSGRVLASQRVSLFGLDLVPARAVHFGPIDPPSAREIFIHRALVEGELRKKPEAIKQNEALADRLATFEHKARRGDLLADQQTRYNFYDERLPPDVYSSRALDNWLRNAQREDPDALLMREADLLVGDASEITPEVFPDTYQTLTAKLPLEYLNNPSDEADGVTLTVPLELLSQVRPERAEWVVPGMLRPKIEALLKTLPRSVRRNIDARAAAERLAAELQPQDRPLVDVLAERISSLTGLDVTRARFRPGDVDQHLRMRFRVVDDKGKELAVGRDLVELRARFASSADESLQAAAGADLARDDLTDWDFGELPERVEITRAGVQIEAFPALADLGETAALRLFDTNDAANASMRAGLARLYVRHLRDELRYRTDHLPQIDRLRLLYAPIAGAAELDRDLQLLIADRVFVNDRLDVRTREAFAARIDEGWNRLGPATDEVGELLEAVLTRHQQIRGRLEGNPPRAWDASLKDIRSQLKGLIYPGCLAQTPYRWLRAYPRFLRAIQIRIDRLRTAGPEREAQHLEPLRRLRAACNECKAAHSAQGIVDPQLETYRWMTEEYRVSLFAQELKTSIPVSPKRLNEQWGRVRK
ncbi:MAG: ATP-dependent RNA helicase HrpA [Planctomycetota bacterium]